MGLQISVIICMGVALATLVSLIVGSFKLHRVGNASLEEVLLREREISDGLKKLCELKGPERLALCRSLAKSMQWAAIYLRSMLHDPLTEQTEEVRQLATAAYTESHELLSTVQRILFRMRFRPLLVKDCHQVLEAAQQHYRMWLAFLRLWRAQYPDRFGDLVIPDPSERAGSSS
jgi:hypothetical protein